MTTPLRQARAIVSLWHNVLWDISARRSLRCCRHHRLLFLGNLQKSLASGLWSSPAAVHRGRA